MFDRNDFLKALLKSSSSQKNKKQL